MATSGQEQQYKIESAVITADRFAGQSFDVSRLIVELNIFENIEKSFLTGSLVLVDDIGLIGGIEFKGSERLTLSVASIDKLDEPFITEKTFIMSKIEKTVKGTDTSEVHLISLVEEHYFLSSMQRISKAYTGRIEDMITNILLINLKKNSDLSYLSESAQGIRKINIPYLNPIDACNLLLQRATTKNGSPLFLYASINDDNIRLGSFDTMFLQKPFNSRQPYIYSSAVSSSAESLPVSQRNFIINAVKFNGVGDNLKMIQNGAVASIFNDIDINTGRVSFEKYTASNLVTQMEQEGILETNTQTMFDPRQIIDDQNLENFNSKTYHRISSNNTYGSFYGYHDVINKEENKLKLRVMAVRNFLYNNMINVNVPGVPFAYSKVSVGDTVQLSFLNSKGADAGTDQDEILDKAKSGKYLVYAARHTFKETTHNISLNLTKLDNNGSVINNV
jgi:hypothetical protein